MSKKQKLIIVQVRRITYRKNSGRFSLRMYICCIHPAYPCHIVIESTFKGKIVDRHWQRYPIFRRQIIIDNNLLRAVQRFAKLNQLTYSPIERITTIPGCTNLHNTIAQQRFCFCGNRLCCSIQLQKMVWSIQQMTSVEKIKIICQHRTNPICSGKTKVPATNVP